VVGEESFPERGQRPARVIPLPACGGSWSLRCCWTLPVAIVPLPSPPVGRKHEGTHSTRHVVGTRTLSKSSYPLLFFLLLLVAVAVDAVLSSFRCVVHSVVQWFSALVVFAAGTAGILRSESKQQRSALVRSI
jgi:hypothetical protein